MLENAGLLASSLNRERLPLLLCAPKSITIDKRYLPEIIN
ncbi:hypothetical protein CES85_5205 [Ochrobactrum quorumnocens]|uniref:Uncharacterized protein n=1 Tax=Ochrobactrum quorumnocens TaxID=271865 RepID=A0A248UDF0_9HYPH|nr:hypothetical protein CES85_5205 [[Ochrobactrum] quorumnocens]